MKRLLVRGCAGSGKTVIDGRAGVDLRLGDDDRARPRLVERHCRTRVRSDDLGEFAQLEAGRVDRRTPRPGRADAVGAEDRSGAGRRPGLLQERDARLQVYHRERNGRALYEYFAWVRDLEWPARSVEQATRGDKAALAFDARVRAGAFELLREWVLVFDPRSRHLYTDQDRANVLMAVALSAQRIADEASGDR